MRLGFVGFGEVGSQFANGFLAQGVAGQVAYDAMRTHPAFGPTIATRAQAAGVSLVEKPQALLAAADVVFLAVPCAAANEATAAFLPALSAPHLVMDVTASSGEAKKRRAGIFRSIVQKPELCGTIRPVAARSTGTLPLRTRSQEEDMLWQTCSIPSASLWRTRTLPLRSGMAASPTSRQPGSSSAGRWPA